MTVHIKEKDDLFIDIPWELGEMVIWTPHVGIQLSSGQTYPVIEKILSWDEGQFNHTLRWPGDGKPGVTLLINEELMPAVQGQIQAAKDHNDELTESYEEWLEENRSEDEPDTTLPGL